jgi:hypothetical protein
MREIALRPRDRSPAIGHTGCPAIPPGCSRIASDHESASSNPAGRGKHAVTCTCAAQQVAAGSMHVVGADGNRAVAHAWAILANRWAFCTTGLGSRRPFRRPPAPGNGNDGGCKSPQIAKQEGINQNARACAFTLFYEPMGCAWSTAAILSESYLHAFRRSGSLIP